MSYIAGGAVFKDKDYYRDETLTNQLLTSAGHFHFLIGIRCMGKTSALRRIWHTADRTRYLPIFLDLTTCGELSHMQRRILRELRTENPDLVARLGKNLVEDVPFDIFYRLNNFVEQQDKTLVLLLDEVEKLFEWGKEDIQDLQRLRAYFGDCLAMRVIMTGSPKVYHIDEELEWSTSPLLDLFHPMYLSPMTERETRHLIEQEDDHSEESIGLEHADRLFEISGGHPLILQDLCLAIKGNNGIFTDSTLHARSEAIRLRICKPNYEDILNDEERAILLHFARGSAVADNFAPHYQGILEKFELLGLLKHTVGGGYKLSTPFLEEYLGGNFEDFRNSLGETYQKVEQQVEEGEPDQSLGGYLLSLLKSAEPELPPDYADFQISVLAGQWLTAPLLAGETIKIMDFGCGSGRMLKGLKDLFDETQLQHIHYTGLDGDQKYLDEVQHLVETEKITFASKPQFICKDFQQALDGITDSFDFVFFINCLHEVRPLDIPDVLNILLKLASPKGRVIIHDTESLKEPERKSYLWKLEPTVELLEHTLGISKENIYFYRLKRSLDVFTVSASPVSLYLYDKSNGLAFIKRCIESDLECIRSERQNIETELGKLVDELKGQRLSKYEKIEQIERLTRQKKKQLRRYAEILQIGPWYQEFLQETLKALEND